MHKVLMHKKERLKPDGHALLPQFKHEGKVLQLLSLAEGAQITAKHKGA